MTTHPPRDAVPITTVSGPLGAGKTTLVNRLLENPGGRHVAVVANDVGELNVDADSLPTADWYVSSYASSRVQPSWCR